MLINQRREVDWENTRSFFTLFCYCLTCYYQANANEFCNLSVARDIKKFFTKFKKNLLDKPK